MSAKSKFAAAISRSRLSRSVVGVSVSRTTAVACAPTPLTIAVGSLPMTAAEATACARARPGVMASAHSALDRKTAPIRLRLKLERDLTAASKERRFSQSGRFVTDEQFFAYG